MIKHNFNRAAANYLQHAKIQSGAAQKLIQLAKPYIQSINTPDTTILDLGCGPGTFYHTNITPVTKVGQIISLDLSLNMLKTHQTHRSSQFSYPVNADAAHLPLQSASIDLVISNLMLQWPDNKSVIFTEINRVLRPNGIILFTTLIQPSLHELQQSWAKLDNNNHTLHFLKSNEYLTLCHKAGFTILNQQIWSETLFFNNLISLFKHFSQTGTNLPNPHRHGLGGKTRLQQLQHVYPNQTEGLPLTYSYLMLSLQKEEI